MAIKILEVGIFGISMTTFSHGTYFFEDMFKGIRLQLSIKVLQSRWLSWTSDGNVGFSLFNSASTLLRGY